MSYIRAIKAQALREYADGLEVDLPSGKTLRIEEIVYDVRMVAKEIEKA